jgi:hypothetical protein
MCEETGRAGSIGFFPESTAVFFFMRAIAIAIVAVVWMMRH